MDAFAIKRRDTRIVFATWAPAGGGTAAFYEVVTGHDDGRRSPDGRRLGYETMFGPARWKECIAWRREHLEAA